MTSSFLSTTVPAPGSAPISERILPGVREEKVPSRARRMRRKGRSFLRRHRQRPPWPSPQRGRLKKAQSPPPAHPHITKNSSHTGVSRCGCCCLLVLARPRRMQTRTLQSGRENTNEGFATSFTKTMFTEHILTFMFAFVKQFSEFFALFLILPRRCAKSAPAPPRRAGRTSAARRTL